MCNLIYIVMCDVYYHVYTLPSDTLLFILRAII